MTVGRPGHALRLALCTMLAALCGAIAVDSQIPRVPVGQKEDPAAVAVRRAARQQESLERFAVFHGFRFTDRQLESGITFRHQVTQDSAKRYKPNHYDHGNGVVVADVDGDQRLDLYFVNQLGANELWRNLGGGRFENVTQSAGVGLADRVGASAAFADLDNDGDADLYVTTVRQGNALFLNDGRGRFTDVTARAGVEHTGHSSGALFFDYDRDGRLDLFVSNVGRYTTDRRGEGDYWIGLGTLPGGQSDAFSGHLTPERFERSLLYRNLGAATFDDVTQAVGLVDTSWTGDAAFTDLDGDGYPDLYLLNMQGDDHLYINLQGERFVDRTEQYFPRTPWGSMGIKFFDWDNDGLLDLMLTDMHSDMSQEVGIEAEKLKSDMLWPEAFLQGGSNNIFGNAFYHQRPAGTFTEISDRIGAENYWPWGLSVGDLNADGWEDVFITASMNFPFRYGVNTLLLNNRGREFLDSEYILGVEPRRDGRAMKTWALMDCDEADREHPNCRGRSGRFEILGTLGSRSSAILDLDGDGDLDIVTNDFNSEPMVLVSDLSDRRQIHFLEIRLIGTRSNRDGLGATVRVQVGETAYTKMHDGASGYLSHSRMPLYFGLGEAEQADAIRIEWPSGTRQEIPGPIQTNQLLEITEPEG